MYCTRVADPGYNVDGCHRGRHATTHIERVVLAHLTNELGLDPVAHDGAADGVKPATLLHLPHDPLFLALLGEDPTEACIVRRPPKRKVEKEEDLGHVAREDREEHKLQTE